MTIDLEKLASGHTRTLARAITLIESTRKEDKLASIKLLESLSPKKETLRMSISGPPGVGKSTFIEKLGLYLTSLGKKVAVLAIDPSSPISGGSLLGDKTRMEQLSREPNAFIRPSPSAGNLGGLGTRTRDIIALCEHAGHEVTLIETVGVGQSELDGLNLCDFFLVLSQPGSGDDLQGVKKGIIEVADGLVINKADGQQLELAKRSKQDLEAAVGLSGRKDEVLIDLVSALEQKGIDTLFSKIESKISELKSSGAFEERRRKQRLFWIKKYLKVEFELFMEENNDFQMALESSLENKSKQAPSERAVATDLFNQTIKTP